MANTSTKHGKRKKIVDFFKETFRAREKSDYKEFFTRGLRGRDSRTKIEYGWMYVRVFVLSFTLFSLIAFLIAISKNGIAVPTLYLLGGAFMNLTVAVFIYELNPERNLSFVLFILILVLGAIAADFITMFGYFFFYPQNEWLSSLWTGVLEELSKAISAIVAILLLKKRSPMLGFIVGAAIGAGFSITEDMGYIYAYAYGVNGMLEISIERAWTAVCTHTLWTAVIGWAFCKFKKPYDLRFLGVVISSIALHFVWDMPIEVSLHVLPTILCVIAAVVFSVIIVKKERKPYKLSAEVKEVQLVIPIPEDKNHSISKHARQCSHSANVIAALTAVLVGVTLILWCLAPVETVTVDKRFKSEEQFVQFVQGDKSFLGKWDKKFEDCEENGEIIYAVIADGKYVYAFISVEEEDGCKYDYTFDFQKDEETGETVGEVTAIAVTVSSEEYYRLLKLSVPDEVTPEGTTYRYVTYATVSDFRYCYYDTETDEFVVVLGWYSDHTAETVASAFAVGILLIGIAAFTAFKIKSRKIRRKENVG